MEEFKPKPTYKEQLDWLDMVQVTFPEASEMIKAIKENVIAVRNYEAAIGKELEPVRKEIDVVRQEKSETQQFIEELRYIEQLPEEFQPTTRHKGGLNPREQLLVDNRIKQLKGELQAQLSLKKPFRSQQAIDHCHKSIENLKKWKSLSS